MQLSAKHCILNSAGGFNVFNREAKWRGFST